MRLQKFYLGLIITAPLLSCAGKPLFNRYEEHPPKQEMLDIKLHLNDTLFSSEELQKYFEIGTDSQVLTNTTLHYIWLMHGQTKPCETSNNNCFPRGFIEIVNTGNEPLLFPGYLPLAFREEIPDTSYMVISEATYVIGKEDSCGYEDARRPMFELRGHFKKPIKGWEGDFWSGDWSPKYPDDFHQLESGQSYLYNKPVDLFNHCPIEVTTPGRYWALVSFASYWQHKKDTTIWIGRIISDTAWFRITE